jgi:trehalose-phosphatase
METAVREFLKHLHEGANLSLEAFDGGLELRALGRNKGDAVRDVLDEEGSLAAAAYLGDDRTDEDAFRAIRGRGLSVLVRPELRETAADWWLIPPADLLWFLGRWHAACAEGS